MNERPRHHEGIERFLRALKLGTPPSELYCDMKIDERRRAGRGCLESANRAA